MKIIQRTLILVFILLAASACIFFSGKKTPYSDETEPPIKTMTMTETNTIEIAEDLIATESTMDTSQVLDPCIKYNLSPEECSNSGTHTYNFVTEFYCQNTESQKIEKITITFTDSSVQVQKTEPVEEEWTYEFEKIAENEYMREVVVDTEKHQITLEFFMNGFSTDTTVASLEDCGKYIRTIISE